MANDDATRAGASGPLPARGAATRDARFAVVIGRFQPPHDGHRRLVQAALEIAHEVIVVLGSAFRSRDPRNPYTWEERMRLVQAMLPAHDADRLTFVAMRDHYDDERWRDAIVTAVARITDETRDVVRVSCTASVGSDDAGEATDDSAFASWRRIEIALSPDMDPQAIRRVMYEGDDFAPSAIALEGTVPAGVLALVRRYALLPWFARLREEHHAIERSNRRWPSPIKTTVDAVVRANDHVLLVERGGAIGHGLLAVPGGFVEPHEPLYAAAVRELREETGLGLLPQILAQAFRRADVFAHPQRSARGRVISHAHYFDLGVLRELPEVHGADDAQAARWVALERLAALEERFHDDHYAMLAHFVGVPERPPHIVRAPASRDDTPPASARAAR